ncbi:MAG: quinate 5-dehydrogenase [Anaerolineae bacterium]|nr:MAG: quinate 5-dehydrogenase [Anaerolineae bacterium]
MKNILSISVGSPTRDHTTQVNFLGEDCQISRQGTNGDFNVAVQRYKDMDGKVDAFGVGGAEFHLQVGPRRYKFRDIKRIRNAIRISKVGDGNGIKGLLAKRAFAALEGHLQQEGRTLRGLKGLKTNAVDRYGMAEAMVDAGLDCVFGDFMFALGLDIPMRSLRSVRLVAGILLPVITQLPYMWFYPLGAQQEKEPENKWPKYYEQADVIAGDFLQIRHYLPPDMSGKMIVTNTTTAKNVEMLQKRGLKVLVTTTPRLEGRSFGTNVMEATLRALCPKPDPDITAADFLDMIERIPLKPNVEVLN